MDERRFDSLTRVLATEGTRRGVLRGVAGGLAAAVGAAFGRRTAGAAPNTCAVGCANLPGPQKAACKQACRQCGGDFSQVCVAEGPFGPTGFVCCPEGTFCIGGVGQCCPVGTEPCFGPGGVFACCPEGTFCDFDTGTCVEITLTVCPTGETAENCAAGVTTDCAEGACALVDDVDNGCTCVERACGSPCTSSADCDGGPCVEVQGCCPGLRFCAVPCGAGGGTTTTAAGWQ